MDDLYLDGKLLGDLLMEVYYTDFFCAVHSPRNY